MKVIERGAGWKAGWGWGVFGRLKSQQCRVWCPCRNGRGPVPKNRINLRLERTPGEEVKTKKSLKCGAG